MRKNLRFVGLGVHQDSIAVAVADNSLRASSLDGYCSTASAARV